MAASNEQHFFTCPSCSCILRTDIAFVGQVVQCPECGIAMEIPLPTHKTQKLKRPQRTGAMQRPMPPEPSAPSKPQKQAPVSGPPLRRRPTRHQAYSPPPPSFSYYAQAPRPAVKKIKDRTAQRVTIGVVGVVLVVAGFLWSQEKQVAASNIGRILPVSKDRHGVEVTGPLLHPPLASNWNVHQRADVSTFQLPNSGRDTLTDMAVREDGRLVATGMLSSTGQFPFTRIRTQQLLDDRGTRNFGWVAEFSADGRQMLWFSLFGGDLVEPRKLAIAPDGSIVIGARALSRLPLTGAVPSGTGAVVLRIRFDGRNVEWIHAGERGQTQVSGLDIDGQGRIYWIADASSTSQTAKVARIDRMGNPAPFQGGGSRGNKLSFDPSSPEFLADGQVGAFYAKSKTKPEGFDYDGPGGLPPVSLFPLGVRQGGDIEVLPTGDFLVSGTLDLEYKLKGQNRRSTTDLMVARFSQSGQLIWSTNLYGELDSIHSPRQQAVDLAYNPASGEVLLLAHQRGTQPNRLKGSFYGKGETVNVSWVGRLDARNGELRDGWYLHCAKGSYEASGFPSFSRKPLLNDSLLQDIAVDGQGRVYLTGMAGAHVWSSPQSWGQWPSTKPSGSQGILLILDSELERYFYSSTLNTDPHSPDTGFSSVVLNETGIWVGGQTGGPGWVQGVQAGWSKNGTGSKPHLSLAHFAF